MSVCTFFGHRDCYGLDEQALQCAIKEVLAQGVNTFYVGNQGQFDSMAYRCLKQLQNHDSAIRVFKVLAYLSVGKGSGEELSDTMYPEIEGHPRFAIDRRNRWMIQQADCCICYVNHTWGGAYKYAHMAKGRKLCVINLGKVML